jgi:hypothetical protein
MKCGKRSRRASASKGSAEPGEGGIMQHSVAVRGSGVA